MTITSKTAQALCAAWAFTALLLPPAAFAAELVPAPPVLRADFGAEAASPEARQHAARVLAQADNQGLPFVIVDKKDARIFVFQSNGQLLGASPALLGLAIGDHSVPGIGDREPSQILPAERTTPAGRFVSQPGRNLQGEAVVWVNYSEGLAIHRLRPAPLRERRSQRLASITPEDNRISLGCVVVPVAFYEEVVERALGKNHGVVYVLPETASSHALFSAAH
jgi:hypothetical protein